MVRAILVTAVLVGIATGATGAVITVDCEGGGDHMTIQEGIDAASETDTVLVAPGTYSGLDNFDLDLGIKNVVLRSASGPVSTIIDCAGAGRGFFLQGGQDTTCVIEGFTVANGYAWSCGEALGGGIRLDAASPTIRMCTITGCSAYYGGGMHFEDSSPVILKCQITECEAREVGGLMCRNSSPRLTYCTFTDNLVTDNFGGGMCCYDYGHAVLKDCTFSGNSASQGGGFRIQMNSCATLIDCSFSGNTARYAGGGVHCGEGTDSVTLTGCSFSNNTADYYGGGLEARDCDPALTDCVFYANGSNFGGTVSLSGSSAELTDCDILSSTDTGLYVCCGSNPTITGCSFRDNADGGITVLNSFASIENCTFMTNSNSSGAGIECSSSSPTITGCTFYANESPAGGSAVYCASSSSPIISCCVMAFSQLGRPIKCHSATDLPVLSCCDMFGNEGGDWVDSYLCVPDQADTNGNMCVDPLFCDAANEDLTLCEESPCLPQWNSCGTLIGALGQGCGLCVWAGADELDHEVSWGVIKSMFR